MGKTFYFLYDKICSPLNIWWAYKDAARGKRYTPPVAAFEYDLEKNLIEIGQELKEETYRPGGYHSFLIDKPKLGQAERDLTTENTRVPAHGAGRDH